MLDEPTSSAQCKEDLKSKQEQGKAQQRRCFD
jgi:hypothetical protein